MDKRSNNQATSSTSNGRGNPPFAPKRTAPDTLSPIQRLVVLLARQAANEMWRSSAFTESATGPHSCPFSSSPARTQTRSDQRFAENGCAQEETSAIEGQDASHSQAADRRTPRSRTRGGI